jgi:myosin-6
MQSFTKDEAFIVKHFAGDVTYCVTGFLDKNMDPLAEDVEKMMNQSSDSLISSLFPYEEVDPNARTRAKKKQTVAGRFTKQLGVLADTLSKTSSHFIRCIKPNTLQKAGVFEGPKVIDQLRCSGMMEALKLMHEGYPTRCPFDDLYGRYKDIMPAELSNLDPASFVECLLMALEMPRDRYQFGLTRVFFKAGQFAVIDELTTNEDLIPEVARKVAIWLMRKRFKRSVFSIISYQKMNRRIEQLRAGEAFARLGTIVWIINKTIFPLARRVCQKLRAVRIQSAQRRMMAQRTYQDTKAGVVVLSKYARRFVQIREGKPLVAEKKLEREEEEAAEKSRLASMKAEERAAALASKQQLKAEQAAAALKKRAPQVSKEELERAQQDAADREAEKDAEAQAMRDKYEKQQEELKKRAEAEKQENDNRLAEMEERMAAMIRNIEQAPAPAAAPAAAPAEGGMVVSEKQMKAMLERMKKMESEVRQLQHCTLAFRSRLTRTRWRACRWSGSRKSSSQSGGSAKPWKTKSK